MSIAAPPGLSRAGFEYVSPRCAIKHIPGGLLSASVEYCYRADDSSDWAYQVTLEHDDGGATIAIFNRAAAAADLAIQAATAADPRRLIEDQNGGDFR